MTEYVQVPREATEEMKRMGARAFAGLERYARDYEYVDAQLSPKFAQVWRAMLAAAPQATDPRDCPRCGKLADGDVWAFCAHPLCPLPLPSKTETPNDS